MAKTKQDWLNEAKALGLGLTPKDKIADIKQAIEQVTKKPAKAPKATKQVETTEPEETAKAGKRSKKSTEEAELKAAKEARKQKPTDLPPVPVKTVPAPKTRSRLERRGKQYRGVAPKIDRAQSYELKDVLQLVIDTATTKFDSTVELHLRLNVDPKQADQNIREVVTLPHGTGKSVKVAVFAPAEQHEAAKQAGADVIGEQDFLAQLDKGQLDFDVLISTPQVMSQLGKYAKLLGPKGLMPNPKSGTITNNVAQAVKQAKGGRLEFRVDAQGIVHAGVGKVSFGADKLAQNSQAVIDAVKSAKPASVKSGYVISVFAASTMGPSVRIML